MKRSALLATMALTLLGCPDPAKTEAEKTAAKSGPGPAKTVSFGAESPQETFLKLKQIMAADVTDLRAMANSFSFISRTSRVRLLGSMYQAARFSTLTAKGDEDKKLLDALKGICVRHGVALEAGAIKGRLKSRDRLQIMFGTLGDSADLMEELVAFALKHGKQEPRSTRPRFQGELSEVKVTEKVARAKATIQAQGKQRVQELTFLQEDGRWVWETPR